MDPRTLTVEQFMEAVTRSGCDPEVPILVATGGWGVTDHERIGLIELAAGAPTVIEDAYIRASEVATLVSQIAHARPKVLARRGGWNTMHATDWGFAWTDDAGPLLVLDARGALLKLDGVRLVMREGPAIARTEVAAVEPYVSADWIERGVRLRLVDGKQRVVAEEHDDAPSFDPTYDGLNLMADTAWTHELARAISGGLGPPVVDCTR